MSAPIQLGHVVTQYPSIWFKFEMICLYVVGAFAAGLGAGVLLAKLL